MASIPTLFPTNSTVSATASSTAISIVSTSANTAAATSSNSTALSSYIAAALSSNSTTTAALASNSAAVSSPHASPTLTLVDALEARLVKNTSLHIEELAAAQQLQLTVAMNRPAKTKSAWAGKQTEYYGWNTLKGYADELVTPEKFLLFLTHVNGRPVYKRGRKRKVDADDGEAGPATAAATVGWNSLDGYVNAVMDIWKQQHMLGKFPANYPPPTRPPSIKLFLANAKKEVMRQENEAYADRGLGTFADELSASEMGKLGDHYWGMANEEGLKLRTDYLFSYALTTRGVQLRNLKLSEIGHKFYAEEGVRGAHTVRTAWRKSKKNQFGNIEQNTCLRHIDVTKCPVGSLATYFFYRYHIRGDPWPQFTSPDKWYDLYVFPLGNNSSKPMTYTKQYEAIKNAQDTLGLFSSSKTNIGRKTGASAAENLGASEASVDKNGHWAVRSRNGAYANNVVPWECVRVLAGFPVEPRQVYVERALVDPPEDLLKQVFPKLELSIAEVKASTAERGSRKSEVAGDSFLSLIAHLRIVLLQDAALLLEREEFKEHPLFLHPLFEAEEFKEYAKILNERIVQEPHPESQTLSRAMPIVNNILHQLNQHSAQQSSDIVSLTAKIDNVVESLQAMPSTMRRDCFETLSSVLRSAATVEDDALGMESENSSSIANIDAGRGDSQLMSSGGAGESSNHVASSRITTVDVAFKMNRSIVSVRDAWNEWEHGGMSNDGKVLPPLAELEDKPGKKWRGAMSTAEGKFFSRRKPLYEAMAILLRTENKNEEQGIAILEKYKEEKCSGSLRKLCDMLKKLLEERVEGVTMTITLAV